MNNSLLKILIFSILSFNNSLFTQTIIKEEKEQIKQIHNQNFETLKKKFQNIGLNETIGKYNYAEAFLSKAKREKDTSKIVDGYYMLISSRKSNRDLLYTDSIISITQDYYNYTQPAKTYIYRANAYGIYGRFKEAFLELHKANFYAKANDNKDQLYEIKYLISRLKTKVGDYQSSLDILKDVVSYYKLNAHKEYYARELINLSWATANNYNFLKKPDSALLIAKRAIPLSIKTHDSIVYDKLLLSTAMAYFEKADYMSSLDTIIKLRAYNKKREFGNNINVLMNLYEGKNYLKQNKINLAMKNFENIDSISTSKNYFDAAISENYTLMYNHYKEKNDLKNQLYYINKLLVTDSILNKDFTYLIKNINNKYTTPNLIEAKQTIIKSLKKSDYKKKIGLSLLSIFCGTLLLVMAIGNRKKRHQKSIERHIPNKKKQNVIIDDETTKRILDGLNNLENSSVFTDQDFSLNTLAKLLNTNTSYLSRIINEQKKLTFKQYLNDFRIRFLIKQLNENPVFKKYSIEALANSVGYTNASSFTRIFKNYTGMSPSEYLKNNK
ncbi:helix-turn-helix domain-containing protein [uncultured Winogradskyella sp.]|uniref:helix-turn-helix domain-containing protein n=1 Tax=uncultured Winogradskyella sp. TaxID=395353 RepID=UPI0026322556|nr:helix-turn-helix domain-containing protein [uncultured Winogradskyella sp.]